jgi:subtilase family serine protease
MNRTRIVILAAAVSVIGIGVAQPLTASATSPRNSLASLRTPGVHYATVQAACGQPAPGHASCLAMRLVPASKGALGAHAYTVAPDATTGPVGGFTPSGLAKAYGVNPAGGKGQTVGIVDAFGDPTIKTDLDSFDSHYGLPAETSSSFKVVNQTGGSTLPAGNTDWAGEQSLDVQAVRGLCHQCKILLVEATTNSNTDLSAATNEAATLGATEISNSYGGAESEGPYTAQEIADYNHPGVVITASTGDNGMYGWDYVFDSEAEDGAALAPSSLNTVVAVGGTSLYVNSNGTYAGETVWNENGPDGENAYYGSRSFGATGGGCSALYSPGAWQKSVSDWKNMGCTGRLPADVSAVADPFTGYDIYQTYGASTAGWQQYGGTSLASPVISAMWALAGGAHGTKYPAVDLYGHLASSPKSVHDVTIGGNGICDGQSDVQCMRWWDANPNTFGDGILDCGFTATGSTIIAANGACNAEKGYDGPTGVGTPNGLTVFKPLSLTVTIKAKKLSKTKYSFSAKIKDPTPGGSKTLTDTWSFGDGTASVKGAKQTHTFHGSGKHTVTLTVVDAFGERGTAKLVVHIA